MLVIVDATIKQVPSVSVKASNHLILGKWDQVVNVEAFRRENGLHVGRDKLVVELRSNGEFCAPWSDGCCIGEERSQKAYRDE